MCAFSTGEKNNGKQNIITNILVFVRESSPNRLNIQFEEHFLFFLSHF